MELEFNEMPLNISETNEDQNPFCGTLIRPDKLEEMNKLQKSFECGIPLKDDSVEEFSSSGEEENDIYKENKEELKEEGDS